MKKFLNIFFAALLFIILILLVIPMISVYLKTPMLLSGYSSSFTMQFNSWFVVLSLVLICICFLFYTYGKYWRKLLRVNLILSVLFFMAQIYFTTVMFSTAKKYNAKVSFSQGLKSSEEPVKPTETYSYLTIYNEVQHIDVFRPQTKSAVPVIPVILVHGGAFIEGNRTQVGSAANWFKDHGYMVFSIDYPLGKEDRHNWESAANSVVTSMGFIVKNSKKFNVNPNKIVLVGGSAGAALVMQADLGLRKGFAKSYDSPQPPVPAGVIAIYPPVSLSELWQKIDEKKNIDLKYAARKYLGGSPAEVPERYARLNLINQLSKGISPTFIIAGEIDHVVNVEATRKFVKKAEDLKLPVSYVEIPYGEHVFDANSNSIAGQIEWDKIEEFLKSNHLENWLKR
ncbi:alpha/beta hydrolase [Chryseobacterium limigenitum]|uniref:Acetyl esterase/lipase n=1 Tax=Chryseobacterium limigenitum TaxID=1612149 RepID=A0A1K2IW70_9FLAO|nr:alpha/beta hydrolase [Chryseobacterium limigenitum]SFZ96550.1 Acetyl esterase/lipase [Chryseobacterium limigenitum]